MVVTRPVVDQIVKAIVQINGLMKFMKDCLSRRLLSGHHNVYIVFQTGLKMLRTPGLQNLVES